MAEGSCRKRCPGGNKCKCSEHPHHFCICADPGCPCHTQQRYENRLQVLDVGRVDPLGMHWRAANVVAVKQREEVTA
jgi:hypothetical protein